MKDEGGGNYRGQRGEPRGGAKGGGKPPPLAALTRNRPVFRSPHSALLPSPSLDFSSPLKLHLSDRKRKMKNDR